MQLENIEPEKKKINVKSILLVFGLVIIIILGISIKSAVDLKKSFPEETSKPLIVPKTNVSGADGSDQNKCYQSIPYNVTLNKTVTKNVSDYFCDPMNYNISYKSVSKHWEEDYVNQTVSGEYYVDDIYVYNNEPYSLCINASIFFKRKSMFDFVENMSLKPVEVIIPIKKKSFYRLAHKWHTDKDFTKYYELELKNILAREDCEQQFLNQTSLARNEEINITNNVYLENLNIEGCFKYTTVEVEAVEEYNETRYEQKEVPC